MKEIKIFENAQFGQIRTSVSESGEPLSCRCVQGSKLAAKQSKSKTFHEGMEYNSYPYIQPTWGNG